VEERKKEIPKLFYRPAGDVGETRRFRGLSCRVRDSSDRARGGKRNASEEGGNFEYRRSSVSSRGHTVTSRDYAPTSKVKIREEDGI